MGCRGLNQTQLHARKGPSVCCPTASPAGYSGLSLFPVVCSDFEIVLNSSFSYRRISVFIYFALFFPSVLAALGVCIC